MEPYLGYAVILAFFVALFSLVIFIFKTLSFGRRPLYAEARQKGGKGILYAFTKGMMPGEKESAGRHPLAYGAGVVYHLGIFSALAYVLVSAAGPRPDPRLGNLLRPLVAVGLISGLGLLLRRRFLPSLRAISCVDDYAANILVDLTLGLVLLDTCAAGLRSILLLVSLVLFLYIPLGKIRHCFFFFYSRILFGLFFGRRGVLPPEKRGPSLKSS